jgi:hypothetical protein
MLQAKKVNLIKVKFFSSESSICSAKSRISFSQSKTTKSQSLNHKIATSLAFSKSALFLL